MTGSQSPGFASQRHYLEAVREQTDGTRQDKRSLYSTFAHVRAEGTDLAGEWLFESLIAQRSRLSVGPVEAV